MTDLELWKAIHRAVVGVSSDSVSEAVAKVRALLAATGAGTHPEAPQQELRTLRYGRDRKERGGKDRAE